MKQNILNLKIDFFVFIYLFFHFCQIIKTDPCTNGCIIVNKQCVNKVSYIDTCAIDCMPDLLNRTCFKCSGIKATEYYYMTPSGVCRRETNCDNYGRIFYNARQCADYCYRINNVYLNGRHCFLPEECAQGNRQVISGSCSCVALYANTTENSKIFLKCYSPGEYCGPEHKSYDMVSKECSTEDCIGSQLKKVIKRTGLSDITRCSTECATGEFICDGYCLDKCPEQKFIKIDPTNTNKKTCVDACDSGYFINNNNECISTCTTNYRYQNSCNI